MKKWPWRYHLICVSLLLQALAASAGDDLSWAVSAGGIYTEPRESKDWDRGMGGEVQLQRWFGEEFALALHAGAGTWDLASTAGRNGRSDFLYDGQVRGDADLVSFGASAIWRSPMSKDRKWTLFMEAGVEHVDLDVSGSFDVVARSVGGSEERASSSLHADSALNTRVAVDLERRLEGFTLFAGIGYTFNLDEPKVEGNATVFDTRVSSDEIKGGSGFTLDAVFARVGLRKRF